VVEFGESFGYFPFVLTARTDRRLKAGVAIMRTAPARVSFTYVPLPRSQSGTQATRSGPQNSRFLPEQDDSTDCRPPWRAG
jgi:hypothetical protein